MRSVFLQAPITGFSKTKLTFYDSIGCSTLALTEDYLAIAIVSGLVIEIPLVLLRIAGFFTGILTDRFNLKLFQRSPMKPIF